jgi:HD-like signal output (HDOD) protein
MSISSLINKEELRKAQQLINKTSIPTPPQLLLDIKAELSNVHPDSGKIIEWLISDIGLASLVIKSINSSFFGFSKEISSIEHAVRLFGISKLKELIIQPAYKKAMETSFTGFKTISSYSHQVGLMGEIITKDIGGIDAGTTYLAGLFHEVGILILGQNFPQYESLYEEYKTCPIVWPKIEREHFGVSHVAIGVLLAKFWGMPNTICNAIYLHHEPAAIYKDLVDYNTISLTAVLKYSSYLTVKDLLLINVSESEEIISFRDYAIEELMLDEEQISSLDMDSKSLCTEAH